MNYTLQLHGERILYPVPPGLPELMSYITRETLRDQPSQLYHYIADLLETMEKVREYSRVAGHLVDDVLGVKSELLAYVESLGVTWEEANRSARKIQGAFRLLKCRRELHRKKGNKEEKDEIRYLLESSVSFRKYLKSVNIHFESSSRPSPQLVQAYREFRAHHLERSHKHASTHTVDTFLPKTSPSFQNKRDSNLLTYQESSYPSTASGWSLIKDTRVWKSSLKNTPTELIYKQKPRQKERYMKLSESSGSTDSSVSTAPIEEPQLPSYDKKGKDLIPMISRSGQLTNNNLEGTLSFNTESSRYDEGINLSHVSLSFVRSSPVSQESMMEDTSSSSETSG